MWEDYPPTINAVIQKRHQEGYPFAQWEEREDGQLRIEFSQKCEIRLKDNKKQKVRQSSEGEKSTFEITLQI